MIKHSFYAPIIAKSIEFKDKVTNIGANSANHIMSATNDIYGWWRIGDIFLKDFTSYIVLIWTIGYFDIYGRLYCMVFDTYGC